MAIGSVVAATYFQRVAREKGELADQRELERDKAQSQERAERWERYCANIMTAVSALDLNNTNIAQRALVDAPEEHCNWEWRYLQSQFDRASSALPSQLWERDRFRDMPVSPDGKHVVLWDESNRAIRLWEVPAGKELAALPHTVQVHAIAYRPDGGQIAIGSQDGSVRL
jgi:hypothetical protein